MTGLTLRGYDHSVYTRIVRVVLWEKGYVHRFEHINPFDPDSADACKALHPFGHVPTLSHNGFEIFETAAIARYLDASVANNPLTPDTPKAIARMAQVVGILDSYGYWPMVRQVYAHRVFRPHEGVQADEGEIASGLRASLPVLAALDRIADEALVLSPDKASLADCHLGPMLAAFTAAAEGAAALGKYAALSKWWDAWALRPSMTGTNTGFDRHPRL